MKKNLLKAVSGLLVGLSLFSCSKEEVEANSNDTLNSENSYKNEEVYLSLIEQGYTEDDIEVFDQHYIVESDMIFEKSDSYSKNNDLSATNSSAQRFYSTHNIYDRLLLPTDNDIYFYINPNMKQEFKDATLAAIEKWNSMLYYSDVNLYVTDDINNATTEVLMDSQETDPNYQSYVPLEGAYAVALAGNYRKYGKKIWIDADGDFENHYCIRLGFDTTPETELRVLMQHEIAHILGFAHTSEAGSGLRVNGTQEDDLESIFNAPIPCFNQRDFSAGDIASIHNIFGMPVIYENNYMSDAEFITNPNTTDRTIYAEQAIPYYGAKYFDGNLNISWDPSIIDDDIEYVRVRLYVSESSTAYGERIYDKFVNKYHLSGYVLAHTGDVWTSLDSTTNFGYGITIPKDYYEYSNYEYGRIEILAGFIEDEAHFQVWSVDR